jgi:hypothetical protein
LPPPTSVTTPTLEIPHPLLLPRKTDDDDDDDDEDTTDLCCCTLWLLTLGITTPVPATAAITRLVSIPPENPQTQKPTQNSENLHNIFQNFKSYASTKSFTIVLPQKKINPKKRKRNFALKSWKCRLSDSLTTSNPKHITLGKKKKKLYMSLRKSKAKQSKNKTKQTGYILLRKSQQRTNLLSATKNRFAATTPVEGESRTTKLFSKTIATRARIEDCKN